MAAAGAEIPRLHLGCELHLTYDNVLACLDAPANFTIAGGSWLLVELPEDGLPDSLTDILASLTDAGLRPIIAHPERSRSVRKRLDLLNSLADLGCTFQITAGTLEGQFGRSLQKSAHELLRRGFAHFIASDAHDDVYRRPDMTAAFDLVRRQYGEQRAQALCRDNPLAVVENRVLPLHAAGVRPLPPQRKWFDFARWRQPKSRGA
jgi:protein-tyrosine phosphatase